MGAVEGEAIVVRPDQDEIEVEALAVQLLDRFDDVRVALGLRLAPQDEKKGPRGGMQAAKSLGVGGAEFFFGIVTGGQVTDVAAFFCEECAGGFWGGKDQSGVSDAL